MQTNNLTREAISRTIVETIAEIAPIPRLGEIKIDIERTHARTKVKVKANKSPEIKSYIHYQQTILILMHSLNLACVPPARQLSISSLIIVNPKETKKSEGEVERSNTWNHIDKRASPCFSLPLAYSHADQLRCHEIQITTQIQLVMAYETPPWDMEHLGKKTNKEIWKGRKEGRKEAEKKKKRKEERRKEERKTTKLDKTRSNQSFTHLSAAP